MPQQTLKEVVLTEKQNHPWPHFYERQGDRSDDHIHNQQHFVAFHGLHNHQFLHMWYCCVDS